MNHTLSIFTYHYVRDLENSEYPNIKGRTIDEFRQQIDYVSQHYTIVRMEDVIEAMALKRKLPTRAALLTFDDGYKDHFDNVWPILEERGLQGTFFIPVQAVFAGKLLDVNKIHLILASVAPIDELLAAVKETLNELRDRYGLESSDYYWHKLAKPGRFDVPEVVFIKKLLQVELPEMARSKMVDHLLARFVDIDESTLARKLYMTPSEIRVLHAAGMHIGSHTYSHRWLDSLNEDDQRWEIDQSLSYLKDLGVLSAKWTLCLPYGAYNESTLTILDQRGCSLAVSTVGELTNLSEQNRLALSRLDTNQLLDEMAPV